MVCSQGDALFRILLDHAANHFLTLIVFITFRRTMIINATPSQDPSDSDMATKNLYISTRKPAFEIDYSLSNSKLTQLAISAVQVLNEKWLQLIG